MISTHYGNRLYGMDRRDAYSTLQGLRTGYPHLEFAVVEQTVRSILGAERIKPRPRRGGELGQINLSRPESFPDSLTLGLRYWKEDDKSFTEDLFWCPPGGQIMVNDRRGRLERMMPEYENTHKAFPFLYMPLPFAGTSVNTICFWNDLFLGRVFSHRA